MLSLLGVGEEWELSPLSPLNFPPFPSFPYPFHSLAFLRLSYAIFVGLATLTPDKKM